MAGMREIQVAILTPNKKKRKVVARRAERGLKALAWDK